MGAPTADHALKTASKRHPQYKPIGVELSDLPGPEFDSFAFFAGLEALQ